MPNQTVKLIPVEATPNKEFHWKVKYKGAEGDNSPTKPYPKVDADENSGPNVIAFNIEGNNSYTFSSDPIWIQKGLNKPTGGVDDQIVLAPQLYNNGKTLAIIDWNTWKGDLTYVLNIDGAPDPQVDPVITNGGGGFEQPPMIPPGAVPGDGYSQSQYFAAAAIALLVGFLIGFFVHKLLFAPKPPKAGPMG